MQSLLLRREVVFTVDEYSDRPVVDQFYVHHLAESPVKDPIRAVTRTKHVQELIVHRVGFLRFHRQLVVRLEESTLELAEPSPNCDQP